YLLTQQYELMKITQRDYTRLAVAETDEKQAANEKKLRIIKRLLVINQLLLQDNILFQSLLEAKKISGTIRIGEKKNWLQRLLRR
ncbi:MAG: hypothetical protein ACTIOL_04190, partial [Enterococcus sp.]